MIFLKICTTWQSKETFAKFPVKCQKNSENIYEQQHEDWTNIVWKTQEQYM